MKLAATKVNIGQQGVAHGSKPSPTGADSSSDARTQARGSAYPLVFSAGVCWFSAWLVVVVGSHMRAPVWAAAAVIAGAGVPAVVVAVRSHSLNRSPHPKTPNAQRATSRTLALIAVVCAGIAAVSAALTVNAIITSPLAQAATSKSVVTAQVRITADAHPVRAAGTPRWASAAVWVVDATAVKVQVHRNTWSCATPVRLLLDEQAGKRIQMGQVWRVVARATPARVGDRSAAYLQVLASPHLMRSAPWWARAADSWRSGLRRAAHSGNADARGLLPALAIGDTSLAPTSLTDDMRAAGLSHLSAVSGANVSIVLAAVVVLALLCGIRGRFLGVVCVVTLIWFVLVARPSPSVVRAAVMGAIGVVPVLVNWRRKPGGVDALLALALATSVLIVIDPWLSVSWGFALSCAATAGLVVGAALMMRWLRTRSQASQASMQESNGPADSVGTTRHRGRSAASQLRSRQIHWLGPQQLGLLRAIGSRLGGWFIAALSVTLCAQLAVTPLLLAMGGSVSWVALPANLLAEPAVAPATVSGLLASAVSQVSPSAAAVVAKPGLLATAWIAQVARRSARVAGFFHLPLPWSHASFPQDTVAVLCDVGQGTAFILPLGDARAIVIDVGPDATRIDSCLRRLGITEISLLVLSHFHADHIAGLPGAIRGRTIGTVLVSPLPAPVTGAKFVETELRDRGITAVVASSGARVTATGVEVIALGPSALLRDVASPPNDDCLAVAVQITSQWRDQPLRVLAPCDLEYAGQSRVLAMHPHLPGHFDIALVPHHGSSKQLTAFARWASPTVALVPVGRSNDYGHPAADTLSLWSRTSGSVHRTDTEGDVVVSSRDLSRASHSE